MRSLVFGEGQGAGLRIHELPHYGLLGAGWYSAYLFTREALELDLSRQTQCSSIVGFSKGMLIGAFMFPTVPFLDTKDCIKRYDSHCFE